MVPTKDGFIFAGWRNSVDNKPYMGGETFTVTDENVLLIAVITAVEDATTPNEPVAPTDDNDCWLCGNCPMFLGLCLWICLAILVFVAAIILIVKLRHELLSKKYGSEYKNRRRK